MNNNGWIKIYNKLQNWEWYDNSDMVSLWVHLLLMANWQDKNWHGVPVKRGQLITGRKSLSKNTGISQRKIRTCLNRLKMTNEISIKTTNKFSIITIINWDKYQGNDKKRPAERPANGPTTDQQSTTPKEYKNIKNIDIAASPPSTFSLKEEIKKLEDSKRRDLNIIALFMEEKKPDIRTKEQFIIAIKRHLRAANLLKPFDDDQILKAVRYAKKEYGEIWQLETLLKILTK